MEKFVVTISGLFLISFIYWFFFGKKEEISQGETTIIVEGGYKPSTINLKKGIKTTLTFIRQDPNSCLEELVIPDFKVKKYLPINTQVELVLNPQKEGEYEFHCGMSMYHGKLIVE